MIDWGLIGTILAPIFFFVSVILAIRQLKRKKPVYAYTTKKVIGLGTDAPPELKLYFDNKSVPDVYRTLLIFFNRGNEPIRKEDITDPITLNFEGAQILRVPSITQSSKPEIRFSTEQVNSNTLEISFLYLDHKDGAVIEILHTKSEKIMPEGNIIGAGKPRGIGKFDPIRVRHTPFRIISLIFPVLLLSFVVLTEWIRAENHYINGAFWFVAVGMALVFYWMMLPTLIDTYRYLRFPKWSTTLEKR